MSAWPAAGLQGAHQLAHVGRAGGAGLGDGGLDGGHDLGFAHLGRQVGFDDHDLGALDLGEVFAVGGFVLADRVLALLDHLVEHGDHGGVVQLDALVHFALLDGGIDQADHAQLSFSPAFMAAFMSSVSCCFMLMRNLVVGGAGRMPEPETQKPATLARAGFAHRNGQARRDEDASDQYRR